MTQPKLHPEKDFLVKDSKSINFIGGGIILAVFFISILGDYGWMNYAYAVCLFLIPGAIAIARGRRNTTIIKINKTGFYYGGKLETTWDLFIDATVHDRPAPGNIRDNFILDLQYYSPDFTLVYTQSIPLTNTQDKAEEEIIEAIQFYYDASREKHPNNVSEHKTQNECN